MSHLLGDGIGGDVRIAEELQELVGLREDQGARQGCGSMPASSGKQQRVAYES